MDLNEIRNEDCRETMAQMSEGFVDLVVTSPPYDGLRDYDGHVWGWDVFKEVATWGYIRL